MEASVSGMETARASTQGIIDTLNNHWKVEAQKANAEQVLASASKAQSIIDKAPSLLAELNPMYKEKQETEQRFGKIEKSISGMEELMKKQQEMMENFIKKFES